MRQFFYLVVFWVAWQAAAQADLTIEITEGVEGALPIAVVPFGWQGNSPGMPLDVQDPAPGRHAGAPHPW